VLWRSFAAGGSVAVQEGFDAGQVGRVLGSGSCTMASLVPTMLHRLLEAYPGPYRGVKVVLLGGAPAGRELVERGLEAGLPITQTYGMTETCSQVATVVPGEALESLGTVGPPIEGVNVAIIDDDGVSVSAGGLGEITVDGDMVSPGYVGGPDRIGPHRTGDLGRLDAAGRLTVVGRSDDVIITGGENVHPQKVTGVLEEHPRVRAAAVVGVPDDEWGQAVVGVVAGDVDGDDVLAWAKERLDPHEVPARVTVVDEMPELSLGKPDPALIAEIAGRER
jgi:O-succinylbenzoic acid--CoA ligase